MAADSASTECRERIRTRELGASLFLVVLLAPLISVALVGTPPFSPTPRAASHPDDLHSGDALRHENSIV